MPTGISAAILAQAILAQEMRFFVYFFACLFFGVTLADMATIDQIHVLCVSERSLSAAIVRNQHCRWFRLKDRRSSHRNYKASKRVWPNSHSEFEHWRLEMVRGQARGAKSARIGPRGSPGFASALHADNSQDDDARCHSLEISV